MLVLLIVGSNLMQDSSPLVLSGGVDAATKWLLSTEEVKFRL